MKISIARISLVIFTCVLLPTPFFSTVPGGNVLIYGFLIFVSTLIIFTGTKKIKLAGVCCLLLAVYLFVVDYRSGEEYKAEIKKQRELIKPKANKE